MAIGVETFNVGWCVHFDFCATKPLSVENKGVVCTTPAVNIV